MCISDLQGKVVASSYLDATTMNSGISLLSRIDTLNGPPCPSSAAGLVSSACSSPAAASGLTFPSGEASGGIVAGVPAVGDEVADLDTGVTVIGSSAAEAGVAAPGEPAAAFGSLPAAAVAAAAGAGVVFFVGETASVSADGDASGAADGDDGACVGVGADEGASADDEGIAEPPLLVEARVASSDFNGSFAGLLLLPPLPLPLLLPLIGIASSGAPYLMPTSLSKNTYFTYRGVRNDMTRHLAFFLATTMQKHARRLRR